MLSVKNLFFSYNELPMLQDISIDIPQGSHLALIGESGSGKSTLLKLLYGHYDLDGGEIQFNGKLVRGPKYKLITGEDEMKYLAQDFGLMPYATTAENVGSFLSNANKKSKNKRIESLLKMVGMLDFKDIKPQFLSGGQQQRVAIAKTLATEPKVLLLDEPFSQIDPARANVLRRNLFAYLRENEITCIVATHNSADVLAFADTVAVMKEGKLIRHDAIKTVYENPMNFYTGSLFDTITEIETSNFEKLHYSGTSGLFYPHELTQSQNGLQVKVTSSYFHGSHYLIQATYDAGKTLFFNSINPIANKTNVRVVSK